MAYKRLDEVEKMRQNLLRITTEKVLSRGGKAVEAESHGSRHTPTPHVEKATGTETQHTSSRNIPVTVSIEEADNSIYPNAELSSSVDWLNPLSMTGDGDPMYGLNMASHESGNEIYSLFHDSTLSLTGMDLADWEELDRQIAW